MTLERLKYHIKQRLSNLVDIGVYDGKVPNDAVFPYLVFRITDTSYLVRTRADRRLEINYWNDSNDDFDILEASNTVKKGKYINDILSVNGLDYSIEYNEDGFYKSYIEFESEIPDSEPYISRIQQRYVVMDG